MSYVTLKFNEHHVRQEKLNFKKGHVSTSVRILYWVRSVCHGDSAVKDAILMPRCVYSYGCYAEEFVCVVENYY